jgi:hypothetical protein
MRLSKALCWSHWSALGEPVLDVEIFLAPRPEEESVGVRISFLAVKELKIGSLDGMPNCGVEIADAMSRPRFRNVTRANVSLDLFVIAFFWATGD